MKFKVFWKAVGVLGDRKQGHDIIDAEHEGEVEHVIDREVCGDTKDGLASKLKIAETVNLFDAGCSNWKITKIFKQNPSLICLRTQKSEEKSMIENLGKPVNPPKCDHRLFLVSKGKGTLKEISYQEAQDLNREAFKNRKPYPNMVMVSDKVVSFDAGDYIFNFVRADLEELLRVCTVSLVSKTSSEGKINEKRT